MSVPKVDFNYSAPKLRADGNILIEPLFSTAATAPVPTKKEKNLRIVKNSEIPLAMLVAGELSTSENREAQYHHMRSRQKIFVGNEKSSVFTAVWLDESVAVGNPRILALIQRVRTLVLAPNTTPGRTDVTDFEMLLPGERSQAATATQRSYGGGFSLNPRERETPKPLRLLRRFTKPQKDWARFRVH